MLWAAGYLACTVVGIPSPAAAAPGDPDRTFGTRGVITTDFDGGTDQARGLVVQPDGKVVAAGTGSVEAAKRAGGEGGLGGREGSQFALARYLPDGRLDPAFGNGGKVITDVGYGDAQALDLVLQPDGKVVAAGGAIVEGFGRFALARYLPDGRLDPTFGRDGTVTTDFPGVDARAFSVVLQPDARLVAAGYTYRGRDDSIQFALGRYLPDGTLDPTFGGSGMVITDFAGGTDQVRALVLQPDGKLVAAGFALVGGNFQFALARYLPDGALDPGFGEGGKLTTDFGGRDDQAFGLALQSDGRLLAVGGALAAKRITGVLGEPLTPPGDQPPGEFALARYLPDGTPDPSFDGDGQLTTGFGDSASATAVLLEDSGSFITAGFAMKDHRFRFALARYLPHGALDPSFAGDGKLTTAIGEGDAEAFALAGQPDGKLVAAGFAIDRGSFEFALARYESALVQSRVE